MPWVLTLDFETAGECLAALRILQENTQLGFYWKVHAEGIQEGVK